MSTRITPDQKRTFIKLLTEGWTIKDAAKQAGFSEKSGKLLKKEYVEAVGQLPKIQLAPQKLEVLAPKQYYELQEVAQDCLEDFARFRARFFGRISSPWQEDAAQRTKNRLATPHKEFGVVNCPPGSGKSTLFTHDIPAWLTCRDRALRGLIGSSTQVLANQYNYRLRSSFERRIPMQTKSEDISRGIGQDAVSTLAYDYGRFKPLDQNIPWSKSSFIVEQYFETSTDEKEATWTAFGRDSGFLGTRVNIAVWDDLMTRAALRTSEKIKEDRMWWRDEAEPRIEPGGLLILQGQRLHPEDLYRFCLDMEMSVDDIEELKDTGDAPLKKYFHVVYKAHYEEKCKEEHKPTATPHHPTNPDSGCLLDPVRLPWRELNTIKNQPLSNFQVVYQQEDVDPSDVLVPKVWIDGGFDPDTHENFIGCYDDSRPPLFIPKDLAGTKLSVVSIDPSATKFWSVQWWLYVEPPTADRLMGFRYLLDLIRKPMGPEELLDWSVDKGAWVGILEDWVSRAKKLGQPITHVIIEQNAAQRWLFKYEWFQRWMSLRSVQIKPHNTTSNKLDPEFGVQTIRNHYRFGRVRFPGTPEGRRLVQPLVNELTRYPDASTDDCVMANWFMEYQLQYVRATEVLPPSLYGDIPGWAKK